MAMRSRQIATVKTAKGYTGRRVPRYPQHDWNVVTRPYQLQPIMIAPVLAGETFKSALFQSRVVSDPIKNPLIGWWKEYFFFYVKLRDLNERDQINPMFLDPEFTFPFGLTEGTAGGDWVNYTYEDAPRWTVMALQRVVEEYFRNEGEGAFDADKILGGLPLVGVNREKWMNSVIPAAEMTSFDVDVDVDGDGTITASEVTASMRMYEQLRQYGLTEMSYEDYLRTHGVSVPQADELHRPELLRNVSDWTYPSNTVDPATGAPSSALSWSFKERIDKDRFFKEPGLILGLTATRPKVYFRNQKGSAVGMMNDPLSWLPALMHEAPETSLKHFADNTGPLGNVTDADGYWVDVRDLLLYGDQFLNYDPAAVTDKNLVDLPLPSLARRYAASAAIDAMFKEGAANKVREDGVITMTIHGRQVDHTPGTPG